MPNPRTLPAVWGLLRASARLLAIVAVWLVVVGVATGCFFMPRGSEAQPGFNDLTGFACSAAVAGAVSATVALGIGGKLRWAGQVVLAVSLTVAALAGLAYVSLWVSPWAVRSRINGTSFVQLRQLVPLWGAEVLRFTLPLGALGGGVFGTVAGLLTAVARRKPRLAMGLALGLLLACATSPVQSSGFDLMILWGQIVRYRIISWGLTDPLITATGAILGATAGALIASIAVCRSRPGNGTQPL
jgi:hypothetical protein